MTDLNKNTVGSVTMYGIVGGIILDIKDFDASYSTTILYDETGDEAQTLKSTPDDEDIVNTWYFDTMIELDKFIDDKVFVKVSKI